MSPYGFNPTYARLHVPLRLLSDSAPDLGLGNSKGISRQELAGSPMLTSHLSTNVAVKLETDSTASHFVQPKSHNWRMNQSETLKLIMSSTLLLHCRHHGCGFGQPYIPSISQLMLLEGCLLAGSSIFKKQVGDVQREHASRRSIADCWIYPQTCDFTLIIIIIGWLVCFRLLGTYTHAHLLTAAYVVLSWASSCRWMLPTLMNCVESDD
jgi:hypothetical protein